MKTPFFFYDPDEGAPQFFATEVERDDYAASALETYRSAAWYDEGWSADVFQVTCGILTVTHTAQIINEERIPRPPDAEIDEDGYDDDGNSWNDQQREIVTFDVAMLPVVLAQEATA